MPLQVFLAEGARLWCKLKRGFPEILSKFNNPNESCSSTPLPLSGIITELRAHCLLFSQFLATTQSGPAQQPPDQAGLQKMWLSLKINSSGNPGRAARHGLCISKGEWWLSWPRNSFWAELKEMDVAIIPCYLLNGNFRDILCWVFERTKFEF